MEQLDQNAQNTEGLSLLDIVKLLLSKIKILILVVLIGGVLGSAFAVWKTIDVNYFGTRVEFYVNPKKPEESTGSSTGVAAGGSQYGVYGAYGKHVMDNMIKLLRSQMFAECLLLNGEILPDTETRWFPNDETGGRKSLALKKAIADAEPYLELVKTAEENYNAALSAKSAAVKTYNVAEVELNREWRALYQQGLVNRATFNENDYFALTSQPASLVTAYNTFVTAQNDVAQKTTDANNAEEAWSMAKANALEGENSPVEKALNIWRTSDLYASKIAFFEDAVSYDYLESEEDYEDANSLARSFIYVTISIEHENIEEGLATATMILDRVKKVVPVYVAANMAVPDGYNDTNCQRITRTDDVHLTNPMYTTTQAIKYGILMAMAAFVVAAVVIIILDSSDKRLRDTEIIVRKFNVPLLGIVPTIEELKTNQTENKQSKKTTEVK